MNAINGAVSVWGGGMFHATVMHAGRYQEMPASSGYKSQRRNRTKKRGTVVENQGGEKQKRGNDREESKRRGNKRDRKQREIQEKEF
jgi:hypothetical protein